MSNFSSKPKKISLPESLKHPKARQKYITTEADRLQLIEYVASKLVAGQNIRKIARDIGLNERTFYKYKVVAPARQLAKKGIHEKIIAYYLQGHNINQTALYCHIGTQNTTKIINDSNITVLSPARARKVVDHLTESYDKPLSSLTQEIIEGGLLGDLYLHTKHKASASQSIDIYRQARRSLQNIRLNHQYTKLSINEQKSLITHYNESITMLEQTGTARVRYHKSLLEFPWLTSLNYALSKDIALSLTISDMEDGRKTGRLSSKANLQLFGFQQRWYQNGKKILPHDFQMTPTKALNWFIGDGSLYKWLINLYSLNFTKKDNLRLKKILYKLNITAIVKKHVYPDNPGDYYYLKISGKIHVERFMDYIEGANKFLLSKAKEIFPYKFIPHLTKSEHVSSIVDQYSTREKPFLVIPTTHHNHKEYFTSTIGFSYGHKAYDELLKRVKAN